MQVYKFGGASLKDAEAIQNMFSIVESCKEPLIVVVSALGKMTNALEDLVDVYFNHKDYSTQLDRILQFHIQIIENLEIESKAFLLHFETLKELLKTSSSNYYNYEYDKIVVFGELFSSSIVAAYFQKRNKIHQWLDIRKILISNNHYKSANILWEPTIQACENYFKEHQSPLFITQGFIAANQQGKSTTLGREGSDYTAGVLSYLLNADVLTVWKDVPGILNADPRVFKEAKLIEKLPYQEAIELAFYGAQIIHPKTIQPIQNKKIPMRVKSFLNPEGEGTLISQIHSKHAPTSIIFKKDQLLLSIKTKDFSFVDEKNISLIFATLSQYSAKVNLMQNSAISFSVVIDEPKMSFNALYEALSEHFEIRYNNHLELITVRNYQAYPVEKLIAGRSIYIEQKSRQTAQFLVPQDH